MTDRERRARLALRHALALPVATPEDATRAMTVLHATEPPTVYLSCWARVRSLSVADVDRALYVDRTLVKQLAMRRTLFVFPRDLLPAVWPSASARVAAIERARMTQDAVAAGFAEDGHAWLDSARAAVLEVLAASPGGRSSRELRQSVPLIDVNVTVRPGENWSTSRVLTHLGATGDIVRGANTHGWHVSRPQWTLMAHWLGSVPPHLSAEEGYREIVRRWLHTFGPGTEDDLVWWLGSTKTVVRAALSALAAVPVSLDGGATGWLLPDDVDEIVHDEPWAALLPVLDPTVMGWKTRDFYLGPHRAPLFDRTGNAGTTAWLNGRAVGCWVQNPAGVVQVHLLEDVPSSGRTLLDIEAARLTAWLDGHRVGTVYSSPAMKAALSEYP